MTAGQQLRNPSLVPGVAMSRLPLFAALLLAVPVGAAAPVPQAPPPPPAWPMFGGTPSRNMANPREKLEKFPKEGPKWDDEDEVKKWESEWVLWKAQLGWRSSTQPVVAGGKVYVGTNNQHPRNPRDTKKVNGQVEPLDKTVLMCFDEKTGKFLWQGVHDLILVLGMGNYWPWGGQSSTPTVVGDRIYYVTVRCTVVCADVNGFADGNQGIQTEKYKDATDADIIWEYDMRGELGVKPHDVCNCSPLVVGDRIFVCTSNGVDHSHVNIPAPDAPTLVCLDRHTGKLLWKDNSPGKDIMHGQWSSPSYAETPVPQVIHGQGDGWLRAFDPATGKLLWKFDGNRKGAKYDYGGTGEKSDFVAMPVVHNGRVYIGTGQEPEHSTGLAHLWCVDLKKAVELGAKATDRDVSPDLLVRIEKQNGEEKAITKPNPASALAWVYGGADTRKWAPHEFKFGRTLSTVCVVDDVVYAAELNGYLHCLNATTGEHYWQYDTRASIWGSPYYVDGKVLLGTDSADLFVFRHDPKPTAIDHIGAGANNMAGAKKLQKALRKQVEDKYLLARIEFPNPVRGTPIVVNGVLYVTAENALFAIGKR